MACNEPDLGRFLLSYELKRLSPGDEQRFEAHLLQCDTCFEDLKTLSQVGAVLVRHLDLSASPSASRPVRFRPIAVAVAVLLAFCAGVGVVRLGSSCPMLSLSSLVATVDEHLDHGELNAAALDLDRARELAPEDPDVLRVAARVALRHSDWEGARARIREAEAATPSGDSGLRYRLLRVRAEVEAATGRPEESAETLERAAEIAVGLGRKRLEVEALIAAAGVRLLHLLDRDGARSLLDRAAEAARGLEDDALRIDLLRSEMQLVLLTEGDYREALDLAERILDLSKKTGASDPDMRAGAYGTLALAYEALAAAGIDPGENLKLAEKHLRTALEFRRRAKNLSGIARAKTQLGRIFILENRLEAAGLIIEGAIHMRRYLGDGHARACTISNLALVRVLQGRPEEALEVLEPALADATRTRDPFLLHQVGVVRGRALLALTRTEDGRKAVSLALVEGRKLWPTRVRERRIEEASSLLAGPRAAPGPNQVLPVVHFLY